jgi:hypothetical protein
MKELYKYVNIPNFEIIQQELLNCIEHDYKSKGTHAFTYKEDYITKTCPTFMAWIKPRTKMPFRLLRFYVTAPQGRLGAHIDGIASKAAVPFGLNIPIDNTKNTYHIFYHCDPENLKKEYPPGYLGGSHPIDFSKCTELEKFEILKPCFTRNDVLHSVENNNDTFRVMFTVRWILHPTIGRTIEEVMETEDLFL